MVPVAGKRLKSAQHCLQSYMTKPVPPLPLNIAVPQRAASQAPAKLPTTQRGSIINDITVNSHDSRRELIE